MRSWIQPLPCEGTISAVLGAALGVILALDGGLAGKELTNLPTQIGLIGYVLVFAVSLHFACTAVIRKAGRIFVFFFSLCVISAVFFNLARLHDLALDAGQRIAFSPDNVALRATIIFLAWLIVQLLLSYAVVLFKGKR